MVIHAQDPGYIFILKWCSLFISALWHLQSRFPKIQEPAMLLLNIFDVYILILR